MGSDMVTALAGATVDGCTFFGHNSGLAAPDGLALRLVPGRPFVLGEKVRTRHLELPQTRQTFTVLGSQRAGDWGYEQGVNEHGVAIGRAPLFTRLEAAQQGFIGTELVRLGLERARTARQAVDLLTDLLHRHGPAVPGLMGAVGADNAFLIADPSEAFAVETAGSHWVYQEVKEIRALPGGASTIRQDWDRISSGLSARAIEQGWWPADGNKLDFASAVTPPQHGAEEALRRWGRATLMLGEQQGHIDTAFVRRLLSDHYEGCADEVDPFATGTGPTPLCQHACGSQGHETAASLVVELIAVPNHPRMAWCALGPPCLTVYLPIILVGELPAALTADSTTGSLRARVQEWHRQLGKHPEIRDLARESLGRLQGRFDQEAEDFAAEAAALCRQGLSDDLQRFSTLFMQHCVERFEEVTEGVLRGIARAPRARTAALTQP
jgi:secernin